MAKNLQTSIKQSIKASSKASLTGGNVFGTSPLDLRFALQKTLDPRVTFTRASTGTYVGSDGLVKSATTNEARFDHNPTTGESLGLLVEEARTNLLLNSATLSTQSATVAAAANTLSFYGTGTVTLTGVSTAGPLAGTGANNKVSLTFTPTVGVLILTVSGSVTNAQLEAGAFPTSYIPTTTATATRAADVASITGTNFSSWYNQSAGTLYMDATPSSLFSTSIDNGVSVFFTGEASDVNFIVIQTDPRNGGGAVLKVYNASSQVGTGGVASGFGIRKSKIAGAYSLLECAASANGSLASGETLTGLKLPTNLNKLLIGLYPPTNPDSFDNGTIARIAYWPVRLANPTLQSITAP